MGDEGQAGPIPEQVGPYKVLRVLGTGSMATVGLAEQSGPGGFRKKVALKIIKPEYAEDDTFIKMLTREAQIGGLLRHPNIIQTLSFDIFEGLYVLVLEFVQGRTVREMLTEAGGGLEPGLALDIGIQACRALGYAHGLTEEGTGQPLTIVHRDIKPGNLMVSQHRVVKVMDFGIARATASWAALTAQGVIRGTPSYMSPEQVLGKELDGRSDLFSVGSVLYEMLTGEALFRGSSMLKVMEKVARVEVGDSLERAEAALPGSAAVLTKLQSPHPDDRYLSAEELGEALKGLLLGASGSHVAGRRTVNRLRALDDLSQVSEITKLGRRPPAATSTPAALAVDDDEDTRVSPKKERLPEPPTKLKKKRKKKVAKAAPPQPPPPPPPPAPKPAGDDSVEEFIYREEEEDEDFFVFEDLDDDGASPAAPVAAKAPDMAAGPGPGATAAAVAAAAPPPPSGDAEDSQWGGTLEDDFFSTGPQPVLPGSMGPGGGQREDTMFQRREPDVVTDAVARDLVKNAARPADLHAPSDAPVDDLADDDDLWDEAKAVATSQELRNLFDGAEAPEASDAALDDDLWDDSALPSQLGPDLSPSGGGDDGDEDDDDEDIPTDSGVHRLAAERELRAGDFTVADAEVAAEVMFEDDDPEDDDAPETPEQATADLE